MNCLIKSLKKVFSDLLYLFLAVSLSFNFLVLYYFIFLKTTTFEVFFASNIPFYNWAMIVLTVITAVLFGAALSMVAFVLKQKRANAVSGAGNSFLGAIFGAISSGCPVCGAWLLPLLGIAGSLAAFPLQGLEIKLLSIFLLAFSIKESAGAIAGICPAAKHRLLSWDKNHFIFNFNKETLLPLWKPIIVAAVSLGLVYKLPNLPQKYKISFANKNNLAAVSSPSSTSETEIPTSGADAQSLLAQVNPKKGHAIGVKYDDLGPRLIKTGAIDLEKFKSVYDRSGRPLTKQQLEILTQGSGEKIVITQDNAYFLLNFFWALGLANKNPILDEGDMVKYGQGKIGSFASTGGWTIGAKKVTDIYSQSKIIVLTSEQQKRVQAVAGNAYRPCCGNSTAFPDCNHGMALLGVLELMAVNNASTDEMYEAAKYFNAFWFPQQYLDLAVYFKAKEKLEFAEVAPKTIVSAEYSSGQGWSKTKKWLAENNLIEKAPQGGGGCGV